MELRKQISLAQAEALRVGDSPLRADQLADRLERISATLGEAELSEEATARIGSALSDAIRVLRRDDDGREAAKHLQSATRWLGDRATPPSPFLDD
jgi:hypothetical protein